MGSSIGELFIEIGAKGGAQAIGALKGLVNSSIAAKVALIAVVGAMSKLTYEAAQMGLALDKYEALTGKSVEQLQKFQYMAAQAGVSAQEVSSAIMGIQKAQTDVLLGKGNIAPFQLLGISPNEDPVKVLEQLRVKINQLPPATARAITSQMGISDNIFYMLSRVQTEMDKIDKRYLLNKRNKDDLVKLNAEWGKFWFMLKQISAKMASLNTTLVSDVLQAIGNIVKAIADIFTWLHKTIDASKELKGAIAIIGIALAFYFAPFYAALALILIIIEDIWGYFNGYDSITGRIMEWIKASTGLNNIFEDFMDILRLIGSVFTSIFGAIQKTIMGIISIIKNVGVAILKSFGNSAGFDTAKSFLQFIKDTLGYIISLIDSFSLNDIFDDTTIEILKSIGSAIGSLMSFIFDMAKGFIKAANDMGIFKGALQLIIRLFQGIVMAISAVLEVLVPLIKLFANFGATIFNALTGNFKAAWQSIKDMGSNAGDILEGIFDNKSIQKGFNVEDAITPNVSNSNTSNNKTNNINSKVDVYVQGGDNPQETGNAVGEAVSDAFFQNDVIAGAM
ncbi:MAG: hypothetical protein LBT79_07940 [Elusimicrobiota bacterium]|jgi:hypothetical protein|nr:hypothetical protein [Elusimicrobiota bacterium]